MQYRILILVLFFVQGSVLLAQTKYTVHRNRKMYMGVIGGVNFSGVNVKDSYRVLESTPQSSDTEMEKDYQPLSANIASQYGLYFSYNVTPKLSIVFQPNYKISAFNYRTSYFSRDTVNQSDFSLEMMHQQRIANINLPIMARYDFTVSQFSPYVQGGIFTNIRRNAKQTIYYDNVIDEDVDKKEADQTGEVDITKHINKGNFGLTAGAGITFFANYFAISLEGNFNYGFAPIVNDKNRYADYSGFSMQYLDVFDQFKMYGLDIQLTAIFPIDNSVSLGILKKSRY